MEKYFKWNGYAMRSEYWAVLIISWLAGIVAMMVAIGIMTSGTLGVVVGGILLAAIILVELWVILSTTARRCRSADINPWWTLALLIPYIGFIATIVFGVLEPKRGLETPAV